MTALLVLLLAPVAHAGLIDDYASRPDWACAYGSDSVSCGGPDSWVDVDAAHTVVICGKDDTERICAETWRLGAEGEPLATAIQAWGARVEADLGSAHWVLTPAQQPDAWLAVLRAPGNLAALEVGRKYVQVRIEPRDPCSVREAADRLDPFVEPVLPEVEGGDRIALALELPWDEAKQLAVGAITPGLVASVLARPERERYDKGSLQRWTFLASEPFQCIAISRKVLDARRALPLVLDEWRKATAPTPAERKLQKARDREQARLARKDREVQTNEDELSDEATEEEQPTEPAKTGLDDVDVGDLLGEDDPADE